MINRRNFLLQAATAALGVYALKAGTATAARTIKPHAAGIQLFTFFNVIEKDVEGTLQKIAGIGYTEIESAFSRLGGYYGKDPKGFAALLKAHGLQWTSHHVIGAPFKLPPGAKPPTDANGNPIKIPPMRNLKDNMQQLVDEAAEGGVQYLVCANTPITTLAEINESIGVLNKTHEACKKAGITFAYHNHDAEFRPVEGKIPYELFLAETTMPMELDIAWTIKGGKDPLALFQQYPGRFPLWHVKDLDAGKEQVLPVGSGTLDYARVFAAAGKAGMQHFFIEHDMPADAFSSATSSYQYLTTTIKP